MPPPYKSSALTDVTMKSVICFVFLLGVVWHVNADAPESYLQNRWYTIEMIVFEKVPVPPTPEFVINVVEKRLLPIGTIAMQLSDEELVRIGEYSNVVNFEAGADELFFVNPWHVAPKPSAPSEADQVSEIETDTKYLGGCWLHVVNLDGDTSTTYESHDDWSERIANLFQENRTRDPRLPDWLPDVWQTFDRNVIDSAKALGLCDEDIAPLFDEEYLDFMRLETSEASNSSMIEEQDEVLTSNTVQKAFAEYEQELKRNALTPQSSSLNLRQTANRLQKNSYRIIDHFSWIQDGQARGKEPNILVQFGQHFENGFREVEGTIAFSVARFLHLNVNLWRFVSVPQDYDPTETKIASPIFFYEIQESRRLALGEVHYFDHPKFGVLVQIRRLPIPDDLTELVEQLNSSS
ncbi:MAG: hypothetical protein F4X56_09460 [Gammaproteobacteria bacterium]|nr:hypothetical protein [Gammaproteobacteria bacterium]MYC26129.1 hypothetical protein [Gammaproteobacteria bacterium]